LKLAGEGYCVAYRARVRRLFY